ncbi:hypothetical protein DMN91_010728 [Ooceraea biroi]|uniref:Periodic tryptophan protein 1-like protein n=1 Tax=Ooceraea biroi TaxID=2015173 RepID=A0A026WL90_OOCBI|nr:periodic tryptophan protein 1 homolog [Ooceraea biroi]EZA55869.1 Periodic tryptophan protein 1-like protein [Ooceraea biroi]RLU16660.1 hypothetical protein DMN91_010728 [Ooceraea biroi]
MSTDDVNSREIKANYRTCTAWVKRGVAAAVPEKVELKPDELERIIKEAKSTLQVEDDEDSDEEASTSRQQLDTAQGGSDEYNFEAYDNESGSIYCNIANVASFGTGGKDPFITNSEADSDDEDDIIKSDDNLLLFGHVEEDASTLEVFVYNEREGSFYCHHDILLSSIPMCVEWLNYDTSDPKPGNLCAIGFMTPVIEVWDLDLMNCLEPAYTLGCNPSKKKKKKRVGHRKAVLDVAWNQNYTHVLASGSVDETVLLWDLENCQPVTKFEPFDNFVQTLHWHPTETHQLLTGCADNFVRLFDCKENQLARSWKVSGEVEKVLWNHYEPNHYITSTNNGYIEYFDIRADKPLWQMKAHNDTVSGLSLSTSCRGLLVSCSTDSVIKVWDLIDHSNPVLIREQTDNLGTVLCLAANPDNGFLFAAGGDNKENNYKVLDLMSVPAVQEKFSKPTTSSGSATKVEKMDIEDT